MENENKLSSLFLLIDDPDLEVYSIVESKILELGFDILEDLSEFKNDSELFRIRYDELRSKLIHTEILKKFRNYISKGENLDLEEGVFILSQIVDPFIKPEVYKNVLNEYAKELKEILASDNLTTDILEKISKYLFQTRNYKSNNKNYHDLSNHIISKVIETKFGIPLSLSFIYMFVAQRLNIPLKGIGLPGHFIVSLEVFNESIYIDPYSAGKLLTYKDCKNLVERAGFKFYDDYLKPVSVKQMLERMIRNMISSYEKMQDTTEAEFLLQYIDILHWKY